MTRDEAADILIEALNGPSKVMRARRADKRRQQLIDGDHGVIRAMYLTAHADGSEPTPEVDEALTVLLDHKT